MKKYDLGLQGICKKINWLFYVINYKSLINWLKLKSPQYLENSEIIIHLQTIINLTEIALNKHHQLHSLNKICTSSWIRIYK